MSSYGHGKVLKIYDDQTVLVSLGTSTTSKVSRGDRLVVYEPGEEITDPETGESLGAVEWPKAFLEVQNAQSLMSLAKAYKRTAPSGGPLVGATLSAYLTLGSLIDTRPAFPVDEAQCEPHRFDRTVRVGDPVRVEPKDK